MHSPSDGVPAPILWTIGSRQAGAPRFSIKVAWSGQGLLDGQQRSCRSQFPPRRSVSGLRCSSPCARQTSQSALKLNIGRCTAIRCPETSALETVPPVARSCTWGRPCRCDRSPTTTSCRIISRRVGGCHPVTVQSSSPAAFPDFEADTLCCPDIAGTPRGELLERPGQSHSPCPPGANTAPVRPCSGNTQRTASPSQIAARQGLRRGQPAAVQPLSRANPTASAPSCC